jgi:hypothetical protein
LYALFPVLGASGLITLGSTNDGNAVITRLVSSPPIFFLGEISYSLYLIHWPISLFISRSVGELGFHLSTIYVLASTLALSTITNRYVEIPFKQLEIPEWFYKHFSPQKIKSNFKNLLHKNRYGLILLLILCILAASLKIESHISRVNLHTNSSALLYDETKLSDPLTTGLGSTSDSMASTTVTPEAAQSNSVPSPITSDYPALLSSWQNKIRESLKETTLPKNLDPNLASLAGLSFWNQKTECHSQDAEIACTHGTGPRRVIVIGDSHARMFDESFKAIFDPSKFTVIGRYRGWCKLGNVVPWDGNKPVNACSTFRTSTINFVQQINPDLIIISDAATASYYVNGKVLNDFAGADAYIAGLTESLTQLKSFTGKIIYFGQTQSATSITRCLSAGNVIGPTCNAADPSGFPIVNRQSALASKFGIRFVESAEWFCVEGHCPLTIDSTLVLLDGSHLTDAIARRIAPLMKAKLQSIGVEF